MRRRFVRALVVIALAAIVHVPPGIAQDRSPQESVAQSATEFAVDLYRQMGEEGKNLFFSPYSIYTVLAPMYGGAAGETAEQLAERYLAEIYQVDYRTEAEAVRKQINAWAEEKTNGRIEEIVNWELDMETHLLLANAIFFKGDWIRQFDEAKTRSMPFHRLDDDTIEVPMMFQLGRFRFGWTDSAQILQLPYQGGDLSMTIVLPEDPQGLPSLEERMTSANIASWQEELSKQDVYVYLPRFKMTSEFDLIKDGSLRHLGIVRALDPSKAEFPGIGPYANWLSIQIFVHKAFAEVNKQGTEAAAVTVGGCFPAGTPVPTPKGLVPIEAIEATWNHPFLVARGADLEARRVPMDLPPGEAVATVHGRRVEARDIREGDVLMVRGGGSSTVIGGILFMGRVTDPGGE